MKKTPRSNKDAVWRRLRRLVSPLKYAVVIGFCLASTYTALDLITPENWIPTVQWMRDWAQLFTLPTFAILGLGPNRMIDWLDEG